MMLRRFADLSGMVGYLRLGLQKLILPRFRRETDYSVAAYTSAAAQAVARIHPSSMLLRVQEVIQETPSTRTFRFQRMDGPVPPFHPGQYVSLRVPMNGAEVSRPYSISSRPGAPYLDLTVRDRPGGFVAPHLLAVISEGDELVSSGPAGSFFHEPLIDGSDLVLLAGGSGVTPFASMVRHWDSQGWPVRVRLVHGSRTPDDVIFGAELSHLAESSPRFSYTSVISEPTEGYRGPSGLLDAERIGSAVGDLDGKTFYLCGPLAMTSLCMAALEELGVPRSRIRRELYGAATHVTSLPGWPKSVSPNDSFELAIEGGTTIAARAGEPILVALERHGVAARSLCRSGECSVCRVKLLSGEVFVSEQTGTREADRERGYIHGCVTHPLGDLRIRL